MSCHSQGIASLTIEQQLKPLPGVLGSVTYWPLEEAPETKASNFGTQTREV
jgi:hypothetical protein